MGPLKAKALSFYKEIYFSIKVFGFFKTGTERN